MKNYPAIFKRARNMAKSLGIRYAAGYLRNQGISVEASLYWLTRKNTCVAQLGTYCYGGK